MCICCVCVYVTCPHGTVTWNPRSRDCQAPCNYSTSHATPRTLRTLMHALTTITSTYSHATPRTLRTLMHAVTTITSTYSHATLLTLQTPHIYAYTPCTKYTPEEKCPMPCALHPAPDSLPCKPYAQSLIFVARSLIFVVRWGVSLS